MRVLITGGTGTLGQPTVQAMVNAGHEVRVLSRNPEAKLPAGAHLAVGDLTKAPLIAAACTGADAVIHLATSPGRDASSIDVAGTATLAAMARNQFVEHVVLVSIVGCDRVPLGYYRAKVAAEQALLDDGVPCTVLRATQFHPFAARLLNRRVVPRGWLLQPVDPGAVAHRLVQLMAEGPQGMVSVAGPQVLTSEQAAGAVARARGRRGPIAVPVPGRLSAAVRAGGLVDGAVPVVGGTLEEWLAEHGVPAT